MKERKRPHLPAAAAAGKMKDLKKSAVKKEKEKKEAGAYMRIAVYGIVCSLIVLTLRGFVMSWFEREAGVRAITPLAQQRLVDLAEYEGEYREGMFWGTYRPHVYFGLRTRAAKSLLAGLMWVGVKDHRLSLRHTCEEGDGLERYGWLKHDGSGFGHQELVDQSKVISTFFVKSLGPGTGYGGDWAVRIRVEGVRNESWEQYSSILFYVHDEGGTTLHLLPSQGETPGYGPVLSGFTEKIQSWELHMQEKDGADINFVGFNTPHMHNFTRLVQSVLEEEVRTKGRLQLPNRSHQQPNTAVFQITGKLPLEFDVTFISGVTETSEPDARLESLSGDGLTKRLAKHDGDFEQRFRNTFHLHEKVDERAVEVAKSAISNMIGGIGYFYGQSRIAFPPPDSIEKKHGDRPYLSYWPAGLYTAVPSRSFFPRGFLWDEGFHQLLISRWDVKISMDIIAHWLDLMNENGWIPREQILGDEARSKVPDEFVLQHTNNANPPTLFLVLHGGLAKKVQAKEAQGQGKPEELEFLERSLPRLDAWFQWFNTTQIDKLSGSYFWHGRDSETMRELNPKTLTSGLDDYPRASHPSNDERHVDLRCWMALGARTISLISQIVGKPNQVYEATAKKLWDLELLNQLHFDNDTGVYYDFGNHSEKVELQWEIVRDTETGQPQRVLRRAVFEEPKLGWVPHFGYVNLFPFLMHLIPPESPILKKQLELIRDEKLLWTDFGLRSLATTSSLHMRYNTEHDAPYWRGPIWININYLVLSALHHYTEEPGPYKSTASSLYQQLRDNLIRNIVEQYHRSGYIWEQYEPTAEGKGKGSHPFTGWSALVVLIMAEMY